MAEEDVVESFEINDYDLENEFNPDRPQFRMSKEQQTYGIWAQEGSSDEDRPNHGRKKSKKNYVAPVDFISGGVKQSDGKISKNEEDEDLDDDDEEVLHRIGLGRKKHPMQSKSGRRGKEVSASRSGSYRSHQQRDQEFGSWEKHTKGIGAKLLLQMGYEPGKGIGKNKQGIVTPVEAVVRKGKGAIGAYGPERSRKAKISQEEGDDQEGGIGETRQWKKQAGKKKANYKYKTIEELQASSDRTSKKKPRSELSQVKVIDLTGREQRVLHGYDALGRKHDKPDVEEELQATSAERAFELPELLHNLSTLVSMSEQDILENDRELRYERDTVVNVTYEEEKLSTLIEQEAQQLKRLSEIVDFVESLETRTQEGATDPLTLTECADMFRTFQEQFFEEYKMYDLSSLAVAIVYPLVKKFLVDWDPLADSTMGLEVFKHWKDILEDGNRLFGQSLENMDSYQQLVWEIWMPIIRTSVMRWQVREPEPLIELVENWMPLLPTWILHNVLDQLVMPRLHAEVTSWNPLTDTMPIHAWLHPWLPLMGKRLEPLYAPLRNKLSNCLTNWHPSDPSARLMIQPWVKVFSRGTMDAFLMRCIVPKLQLVMQEFVINPHQQHLDGWNWVMSWQDLLPSSCIVNVLEKHFFSKWLQVLCSWLNSNPNYEEVTKWYMGWKRMFSERLLNDPIIKENINRALDIMNRSVTSPGLAAYQPGARENIAYLYQTEKLEANASGKKKTEYEAIMSSSSLSSSVAPSSFRDIVERRAEESGILMMPIPNKTQEGKPVYRFGNVQMYIDKNVLFVNEDGRWGPRSLSRLIELATMPPV
ncbi:PREDICTED: tuftelin-interacting protein 11-like [Priapulus caudatus]|uniref:Tuftelin-interacting protein 11-like n=1 Tax=Priapulus caudatus TaxID=37621 RepID=A0ABM1DZJ1_PRICU|nr:PREDICTED: tuftelin-interacting protein 11-like [Priapulus caudatus]XP_014665361.1 PREDICTED: tuftelin-interacting protein 11-like [Priapulus caudatus]XP_014665362.1 PREDICTED: tuftelin-interacting protein 11-like [Priapulus caudatus]